MAHCQADARPNTTSMATAIRQRETLLSKVIAALNFIFSKVWNTCPAAMPNCANRQSPIAIGNKSGTLAAPTSQGPDNRIATTSNMPSRRVDIKTLPQYKRKRLCSGLT
jgi:hypothetical protein